MIPVMCLFTFCCRLCDEYNVIAKRLSELPLNTEELVEFDAFLKKSSKVTASKLRQEVSEAARRLEFLMDYADLTSMSQLQIMKVSTWKYLYIDTRIDVASSGMLMKDCVLRTLKHFHRIGSDSTNTISCHNTEIK